MTPEAIAATAGIVLSLLISYVPRLKDWFDQLTPTPKRLVMLGLLLVAAAGTLAYQCRGAAGCYTTYWEAAVTAFVIAAIANQSAFALTPIAAARRAVRAAAAVRSLP